MARDPSSKRPSRLLNLNKASASNRRVSVDNARHSPLLSLPPEIRSRIWDYVVHVGVIHVAYHYGVSCRTYYELWVCQCPEVYEKPASRVLLDRSYDSKKFGDWCDIEFCMVDHHDCICDFGTRKALHQHLDLRFLRTCRLIYHEAVLKPFSVNEFQAEAQNQIGMNGFHYLMEALVPTQIRAIKRLRLMSLGTEFMKRNAVLQLKGLEHLSLEMLFRNRPEPWELDAFSSDDDVTALLSLALRTLHISLVAKSKSTPLQANEIEAFITWEKGLEDKLLKRSTNDETSDTEPGE